MITGITYNNTLGINKASYDPTHTITLRNLFAAKMNQRFSKLVNAIRVKIVDEDCFGLEPEVTINAALPNKGAFNFPRSSEKVEAFMKWLQEQVDNGILSIKEYQQVGTAIDNAWTNLYVEDSYKRGIIRANYELQKAGYVIPSTEVAFSFISLMPPLHLDRLGLLYSRVFTDLKGITQAMDTIISRILTQGIADGDGPRLLARKLISSINGTGIGDLAIKDSLGRTISVARRAELLARTEIIRSHHQAMIQEYRNWGVWGVNVIAEIVTAGDSRVCQKCQAIADESPYTLDEAMNLIPVHPLCRCLALPFEQGVDTLIPKR